MTTQLLKARLIKAQLIKSPLQKAQLRQSGQYARFEKSPFGGAMLQPSPLPASTVAGQRQGNVMRLAWRYLVSISLVVVVFSSVAFRAGDASASIGTSSFEQSAYGVGVLPMATHHLDPLSGFGVRTAISDWSSIPSIPASSIDSETLWLARCIFSETKDPGEMELVAWVVRNRVDSRYRGQTTYQGAILDPFQFSAFNPSTTTRFFYTSLPVNADLSGWQEALKIAYLVRTDDGRRRPFSMATRHFYSELSMVGRSHPTWAAGLKPVDIVGGFSIDERRFRFFEGIS